MPLLSVHRPSRAGDKKNRRGFIDRQRKVVGVEEEKNRRSALVFALTDAFEKIRKKNKTTSVHMLTPATPPRVLSWAVG